MGNRFNSLYILYWCLLGVLDYGICFALQSILSFTLSCLIGVILLASSFFLAGVLAKLTCQHRSKDRQVTKNSKKQSYFKK